MRNVKENSAKIQFYAAKNFFISVIHIDIHIYPHVLSYTHYVDYLWIICAKIFFSVNKKCKSFKKSVNMGIFTPCILSTYTHLYPHPNVYD